MRLPILDSIVISVSLPVLKDRAGKLCAKKVLCLAGFVLLLAAANYNAEAATVGFTDIFGGMTIAATRRAMSFTMPEDGTITSISMYHYEYPGEDKYMLLGVYSDTGSDRPGDRLALTQETITSHSTGWQTIDLINPVFVAGGADIWLAWVYEANPGIFYRSGSPSRADSGVLWNSPPRMPDPFGESTIGGTQYSIYATYTPGPPDTDPPTPTTSTWDSEPAATGPFSISMTATEATDPSGVEYYFENETDGGHNSSWQPGRIYNDFDLTPETQYTYRLKTRDQSANHNEGNWSVPSSATTDELYSVECPPGDLDENCEVNLADVLILAGQWLDAEGCVGHPDDCADLDEQGGVTATDFAIITANWLKDGFVLIINEVMSDNETTIQDEYDEYDDWIEIYNSTNVTIDMAGLYLGDNDGNIWEVPAGVTIGPGEYKLFWADNDWPAQGNTHTNFGLSNEGDGVTIYHTDGVTVIDTVDFGSLADDMSYGRWPDITGDWMLMSDTTPGTANTVGLAGEVYFSRPGGTFTSSFDLGLTTKSPTAQIYYTTDRSIPTDSSTIYSGPISIGTSSTTVIRARAYDAGLQAGPVTTKSYIPLAGDVQSFNSNLPVVVLDTFGFDIDTENEPWVDYPYRPVASAFIDTDRTTGRATITDPPDFAGRAGLKVRGDSSASDWMAASWARQYSFETWTEADGEQDKNVSILGFPAESDWILHIPFDDKSLMRNVLAYKWSNAMGNYAVRTKFVELFLNKNGGNVSMSDYWGIYIFMEKIRVDDNRVDIARLEPADNDEPEISGGYIIKHDKNTLGDETFTTTQNKTGEFQYQDPRSDELTTQQKAWIKDYLDQLETALYGGSFTDPLNGYAKYMEVDTFIDFFWMVEITKQVDSYVFSTYMHKDRNGKLKMGPVWDFNIAFGNPGWYYVGLGGSSEINVWYTRLRQDAEYNLKCADRWFELRENRFNDTSINADLDYYYNLLSAEAAARHFDRWQLYVDPDTGMEVGSGGVWASILNAWTWPNWYYGTPNDPHTYQMEVEWTKNWLTGEGTPAPGETYDPDYTDRVGWIDTNIAYAAPPSFYVEGVPMNTGGHADAGDELTMDKGGAPGTIYYTTDPNDPRLQGGGISPSASSTLPFTLSESTQVKARIKDSSNWSALNSATFAVGPVAEDLRITEIMYHPPDPNHEFIELKNIGGTAFDLNLVKFTDGIDFTFPSVSLSAGDYCVVVRNETSFIDRYGSGLSSKVVGEFIGAINNAGERIELQDALGQTILNFRFKDGWYPITDGADFSLNIIDPTNPDPNSWEYAEYWQPSSVSGGTPGGDDTGHVASPGDIVINEVMTHTNSSPQDWIELHNTTSSTIDITGWFLSDDPDNFKKYEIGVAAPVTIDPNGYVVFTQDDDFGNGDDPGSDVQFALSELGETVYLCSGSGGDLAGGFCTKEDFKASEDDVSFGRYTKSAAAGYDVDFVSMAFASSGSANGSPKVGPVVITEIMYHPPNPNSYAEYVEIKNISGTTVSLEDWRLTDESGGIEYYIPSGTSLNSNEYLLLVKNQVAFEGEFGSVGVTVLEWLGGRLNNAGEKIQISKPGTPEPSGFVPYIRVDRVNYSDGSHGENFRELGYNDPWPMAPDGTGQSLHRVVNGNYGNDVANWQATAPSPGS